MKLFTYAALTFSTIYLTVMLAALVCFALTGSSFISLDGGSIEQGLTLFILGFGSCLTFGASMDEISTW